MTTALLDENGKLPDALIDEVLTAWTADLRSGDFIQGTAALFPSDTHDVELPDGNVETVVDVERACCLGVMCVTIHNRFPEIEAAVMARVDSTEDGGELDVPTLLPSPDDFRGFSAYPPLELAVALGAASPRFQIESYESLSELNDTGQPFPQIADVIDSVRLGIRSWRK